MRLLKEWRGKILTTIRSWWLWQKANTAAGKNKLSLEQIKRTLRICGVQVCKTAGLCPLRDQDMVGTKIMSTGAFELAKDYVRYRYVKYLIYARPIQRIAAFLSLIGCNNEDVKQEVSKKSTVNSVQRLHGREVSKDLTEGCSFPRTSVRRG